MDPHHHRRFLFLPQCPSPMMVEKGTGRNLYYRGTYIWRKVGTTKALLGGYIIKRVAKSLGGIMNRFTIVIGKMTSGKEAKLNNVDIIENRLLENLHTFVSLSRTYWTRPFI
uniref:Uncharacterized protein n=1 Tax=Picea sitchensis TaxID=3332 RepID=D5ABR6_PICSI|nr:unknown [Picea sitchensis]